MKYRFSFRVTLTLLAVGLATALALYLGADLLHARAASTDLAVTEWPRDIKALIDKAQQQGRLPVIVGLRMPEYSVQSLKASPQAVEAQRVAINQVQNRVLNRLTAENIVSVKTYAYIPYLAMHVDAAALTALLTDPDVVSIVEDVALPPMLDDSIPLIKADNAHLLNYRGQNQAVAILDTGVDRDHPDLNGKVVSEACFSTNSSTWRSSSLCPNGNSSQIGTGVAAPPPQNVDRFDHGTHVAAIAAGVAPRANIVAIQVFSRQDDIAGSSNSANRPCASRGTTSPCVTSYTSDQLLALQRVFELRNTFNIAAVNMSIGGGIFYLSCDTNPTYLPLKTQIDILRAFGIATVISSGNDYSRIGMAAPACISSAISVGATTTAQTGTADQVADFSNMAPFMTMLAPGTPIKAAVPDGNPFGAICSPGVRALDYRCVKGGTSMAAPHVAGAIAVMRSAKANATVNEIVNVLTSTGPAIRDQRSGGFITKRRLDVYSAVCRLVTCDADDFRTIRFNQTFTGFKSLDEFADYYYFDGLAGQPATIRMDRSSGNLDPFLILYGPGNSFLAYNNNGGGGTNARIDQFVLPRTGRYQIQAVANASNQSGSYTLRLTQDAANVNPPAIIARLQRTSATVGTVSGFWLGIEGESFLSGSQVRWNGSNRPTSFVNDRFIWGWVYPTDLSLIGYNTVTVFNPTPGGGSSQGFTFAVVSGRLGVSELVAPTTDSLNTGVRTTLVFSWTHPTDSWRVMENIDFRLHNQETDSSIWLRFTEGSPTSTLSLLGAEGTAVFTETLVSGQWGMDRDLILTDTVSLHMGETRFFGSGQTVIISPTLTFGEQAVGAYIMEFSVDDDNGEIQDEDTFGALTILPAGCDAGLSDVTLSGTFTGTANTTYSYVAGYTPANASTPITYTWFPEPDSGQGTANATYNWPTAGRYPINVVLENCASFRAGVGTVAISSDTDADLAITKEGPAIALAGETITYTLTLTNSGAATANNLNVFDVLPTGANYIGGGNRSGNVILWSISDLPGFGTVTQTMLIVTATSTISNSDYGVSADGGHSAMGSKTAVARIVDAKVEVAPVATGTLIYTNSADQTSTRMIVPGGSVFEETTIAYDELASPTYALSSGVQYAGRAFNLEGYQANRRVPGLTLAEVISITLSYSESDIAGLDEEKLALHYWDGSEWSTSGITCTRDSENNQLACEAHAPPLTQFALFEGQAEKPLYVPLILNGFAGSDSARITDIALHDTKYAVSFETFGFTPQLPGQHVHFFFDTVPPEEAGVPGSGPWFAYGGASPFTEWGLSERPVGAMQMCILVANPDHSVQLNTGNCYDLP